MKANSSSHIPHLTSHEDRQRRCGGLFQSGWSFFLFSMLILGAVGCGAKKDPSSTQNAAVKEKIREVTVSILIIGDKKLGAVIKRQFSSRRNGTAHLTEMTWDDFVGNDCQAALKNDIVVYPSRRIGELASRELLVPLTEENTRFEENAERALLISDRGQAVGWGGQQIAMSLGQSHWVMLYHQGVLDTLNAEPADSWDEFDKLAKQVGEMQGSGLPGRIAIPLADHWASYSLMARVGSAIRLPGKYSSYFDVSTMQPLVDLPPFHASLLAWKQQVDVAAGAQTPEQIFADFRAGKVAVAMLPVNRYWAEGEGELPPTTLHGVPGWSSVFDISRNEWKEQPAGATLSVPLIGTTGMLASCSAGSSQQRNAIEVINWITSKQISSIVSIESPNAGLSRKSHLGNPAKWLGDFWASEQQSQFADYLTAVNGGRRMMSVLRIPESDRYLNSLDECVRAVILDEKNTIESLSRLALDWSQLNTEIGSENQKSTYRQSEGLSR